MTNKNQDDALGSLSTLTRKRLGDQISDVLRKQILLGDLKPGRNIPERETAAALGVSRTPLREALLILEGEGLVRMSPARSPIVADPTIEEFSQLLSVQSALEALAGEIACKTMTDAEFARIESLHEEIAAMSDETDPTDAFAKDMEFHCLIVAATHNLPLIKTHKQYNARLWRARYLSSRRKIQRARTLRQHSDILEGLRARDCARASEALGQHLKNVIENLTNIYADEKNPN